MPKMTRGQYFIIDMIQSIYICQDGSLDMYQIKGDKVPKHVTLSGVADQGLARAADYMVEVCTEEHIRRLGLWRGSFMRTKLPVKVKK